MSDYSAQGSITVKRLRSGDTITLSFSQNKIPLYQSVDTDTGSVSPDWSVAANQPTVTPSLTSARGNSVSLVRFTWKWNGTNVEEYPALFSVDSTTGALTITGNLASTENYANDVLTFTCTARCAGVEYTFERAIDVVITKKGASSYEGFVTADYTTISTEHETATATLSLFLGETQLSEYFVKWYKGSIDTPFVPVGSSTQATNTVTSSGGDTRTFGRADVDGTALFIAEFYLSASDTNPVTCAALRIVDASDEYNVVFGIVSGTQVDDSSSVVVQANLVNNRRATR